MSALFRETVVGQAVNYLSSGRLLPYPDQLPDWTFPRAPSASDSNSRSRPASSAITLAVESTLSSTEKCDEEADPSKELDASQSKELELGKDPFLVGFDGPEDPDNPKNWSVAKKACVTFTICLLTFSVYIGSAVYTSSIPALMEDFGVSQTVATLGLSLFVLAYGIGPMFLSPLSEIPIVGRNPVYIATLLLFVVLQIPAALAKDMPSLLVLRFLTGFIGSPALATGGASLSDMFREQHLPYVIGLWAMAAVAGPVLGPVIGGFAAQANGWRWPLWELFWTSAFALLILTFSLPETSTPTILLRKARRLRARTGDARVRSQSEIDQDAMSVRDIAVDALWRPFQLALEPAVLFLNTYIALAYAIFYLWFEAFPLIYVEKVYRFNLGQAGLPFLGIIVSGALTFTFYALYNNYHIAPIYARDGGITPEKRLELALYTAGFIPISLLVFGWTARASVHWIVPTIGAALYLPGIYLLFQCALVYLPMSYPKYAASLLAGNDFFRSTTAAGFPLFGKALFVNLGIGGGSSLLAGFATLMIPALWALIKYGPVLRARSKHASTRGPP